MSLFGGGSPLGGALGGSNLLGIAGELVGGPIGGLVGELAGNALNQALNKANSGSNSGLFDGNKVQQVAPPEERPARLNKL